MIITLSLILTLILMRPETCPRLRDAEYDEFARLAGD